MDVVTGGIFIDRFRARPDGQVRRCQVSRAAEEFWQQRAEGFDRILRRFTAGDFCRVSLQFGDDFFRFRREIFRHVTFHTTGEFCRFLREGFCVSCEFLIPDGLFRLACFFGIPLSVNLRRNFKWRVFPAQLFAGQCNFCVAQRCAVRIVRTGFVWRTETDDGFAHQQGWFVSHSARFFYCAFDRSSIVAINATYNVPAVGFETFSSVVSEPAFNVTINGDAVVIVERNQFAQFQGTGQRAHFVRNAFHHTAVAHEGVGEVVNDVVAWTVELCRQRFLCNRHTDRVRNTLTQRTGSGLNASGVTHFRVTWSFGMQLAEVFQLFDWQRITCEVQQAIDKHRAVAVRQYETVTVSPGRVLRVMVQEITPQDFGNVSHTHRGTRVTGFGFLYCVHAQRTNSISKLFT
ncbi:hypothetical protein D3C72_1170010 [compost metagenome]